MHPVQKNDAISLQAPASRTERRERFLREMDQLVPWKRLVALIESRYRDSIRPRPAPRAAVPRREAEGSASWQQLARLFKPQPLRVLPSRLPALGVERMLRLHFLQVWFGLTDLGLLEALQESQPFQAFVGMEGEAFPKASEMLFFRDMLEQHALSQFLIEQVSIELNRRRLLICEGASDEASIISFAEQALAPSQVRVSSFGKPFSKSSRPQTLVRDDATLVWPVLAPLALREARLHN